MPRLKEQALNSHYDNLAYYSPLDTTPFNELCRMVDITPTDPILDVGCGDGRLAKRNPEYDVTGVDYNQTRATAADAIHSDLYKFLEQDTNQWGLVVFIEVLEHLEEPLYAVELARARGPVLATVPLNLPYVAHLHVWNTVNEVDRFFTPTRFAKAGRHAVLYWSPL